MNEVSVFHVLWYSLQKTQRLIELHWHGYLGQFLLGHEAETNNSFYMSMFKYCTLQHVDDQVVPAQTEPFHVLVLTMPMHFFRILHRLKLFLEIISLGSVFLEHIGTKVSVLWVVVTGNGSKKTKMSSRGMTTDCGYTDTFTAAGLMVWHVKNVAAPDWSVHTCENMYDVAPTPGSHTHTRSVESISLDFLKKKIIWMYL